MTGDNLIFDRSYGAGRWAREWMGKANRTHSRPLSERENKFHINFDIFRKKRQLNII